MPSWTATRRRWSVSRTVCSRSTSSGRSASGPPPGCAGPSKAGPSGIPRPTTVTHRVRCFHGCYSIGAPKGPDIRRWAKKNKASLCFTPTCVCWANPVEAHFGPLRQFTVANSNHRSHTVQTRALHAYLRWRNANAHHPDVLAAQRRERARVDSKKGIRWGGRLLQVAA